MTNGDFTFVDDAAGLERSLEALAGAPVLAMDTEFLRERTYYAAPALVQLSDGVATFLFDPVALDLRPLTDVLNRREGDLVFHAPSQDLEILHRRWALRPARIFDTQIASMLLGFANQVSLNQLLEEFLGVRLEKKETVSDWMARPLSPGQLAYARDDVAYLPALHAVLAAKLREEEKSEFLAEECRFENFVKDPLEALIEKHVRDEDSPYQRALLRAFLGWREELAARKDLPRGWLLKDEKLFKAARNNDSGNWVNQGILSPREYQKYGDKLKSLQKHCASEHAPEPSERIRPAVRKRIEKLGKNLKEIVRLAGEERRICASLLCNQRTLLQLASETVLHRRVPALEGWRGVLLNPRISALFEAWLRNGNTPAA